MQIVEIHAREILDSRGNPTIEVEVRTVSGAKLSIISLITGSFPNKNQAGEKIALKRNILILF